MSFTAGRGTVFTCRALPELQRPHYMHLSPCTCQAEPGRADKSGVKHSLWRNGTVTAESGLTGMN